VDVDSVCQGSKNPMANPATKRHVTVRVSFDEAAVITVTHSVL
jgi:hypothetical protein